MLLNNGLVAYGNDALLYFASLLVVLLASYLLGSLNSAIIVSRALYHEDVRTKGSGNAGLTNMLRNYGKKGALLTLFGDIAKTAIALLIAGIVFGFHYIGGISIGGELGECYMAGLFAVLGHIFPVYYRFKGGKGVLVTSTMALILTPIPFAILLLLFVLIVWMSKYVSLGSVLVAVLYPVLLHGYFAVVFGGSPMPPLTALASIALAILIVWCHRSNLVRLGNRTENKLSFGKKKDE